MYVSDINVISYNGFSRLNRESPVSDCVGFCHYVVIRNNYELDPNYYNQLMEMDVNTARVHWEKASVWTHDIKCSLKDILTLCF